MSVRFNFSLLLCLAQALQVFQNERAVCGDLPQRRAAARLLAVCAGVQLLFPNAVMYGAELVAEWRFCALYAAAGELKKIVDGLEGAGSVKEQADYCRDSLIPAMGTLRSFADELEPKLSKKYIPFPTYGDLLFSV